MSKHSNTGPALPRKRRLAMAARLGAAWWGRREARTRPALVAAHLPRFEDRVEILRDARGLAHVYAERERDLYAALGFLQAADRFFQLDLLRHVASARLCEWLGNPRASGFAVTLIHLENELTFDAVRGHAGDLLAARLDREAPWKHAPTLDRCDGDSLPEPPVHFEPRHRQDQIATGLAATPTQRPENSMDGWSRFAYFRAALGTADRIPDVVERVVVAEPAARTPSG